MAIFGGIPIEIVPAAPFLWIHDSGGMSGRFTYAGKIYIVGFAQSVRDGVVIGKSADGITWTYFFQGVLFPPEQWTGFQDVVLDSVNGKLVFVALESFVNGNLATFTFDLVGETFSAISYASMGIFNGTHPFVLARRPNGDLREFYYEPFAVGGKHRLMCLPISGGVYGVAFVVDAGAPAEDLKISAAISDSSGTIHIAYTVNDTTLAYITLDSSDTPGTRQTITSGGTYRRHPNDPGLSNAIVSTTLDSIIFTQAFPDTEIATVYIGTPVSAPVWTVLPLHGFSSTLKDHEIIAVDAGSTIKFLYQRQDVPTDTTLQIMEVDWSGTALTAPAIYWDIIVNPPTTASAVPSNQMFTDGITADLTSGTLGVAVTTVINLAGDFTAVYVPTSSAGYRNRGRLASV